MIARTKHGASAGFCLTLLLCTTTGDAGVGDFLSDVGRTLGKPFGGFVESLITPSLEAVNNTVVADVDRRLEVRIEQVNRAAGGLLEQTDTIVARRVAQVDDVAKNRIDQVNLAVADRLTQADGIMAARIAQVGVTGQKLIDHAVGRLDGTLDKNIKLVGVEARKTIAQVDEASKARLVQVDGIMEARITQLQGVARQSVADVDQALEQRLEQVDEISERRVGNLDVIGTRQILNLESTLVRLAGLVATLTLVVLMLYSMGKELWSRWEQLPEEGSFFRRVWTITDKQLLLSLGRVVMAHALILGACVGVLLLVSRNAPKELAARELALLAQHRSGFDAGEKALDYRAALYHASQLAIIEPTSASAYDLRTQKLKLIRDTLVRPGMFERPETVRNLARQIATLGGQIERATKRPDPDLLTLQCYIRWQVAQDRPMEAAAAADCRRALALAAGAGTQFLLERLARHYVHVQEFFPSFGAAPAGPSAAAPEAMPGLEHVGSYDALVQKLDRDSTKAYLALLDAQVDCAKAQESLEATKPAAKPARPNERLVEARARRTKAAGEVVAAWKQFDAELTGNEWLSGTSSELGVFLLNDAILTRALYVLAVPDAPALPQKIKDIADPLIRIRVAPPRIEWMRRYLGWVGDTARRIVTFEEAKRFSDFEDQVIAFEGAYLALKGAATPSLDQRIAAARAAATLTLYVSEGGSRLAFAAALLGTEKLEPMQRVEIEALANARRLRLL